MKEIELVEAYVCDDKGNILDSPQAQEASRYLTKFENFKNQISQLLRKSEYEWSNSNTTEDLATDTGFLFSKPLEKVELVEPPVDPELLSLLIRIDEVHKKCCDCKVTDSVLREYDILPKEQTLNEEDEENQIDEETKAQILEIEEFIEDCSFEDGFEGVLKKAGIDLESIGWCAIEVVRSLDMKARKIYHIPAERVRVIQGRRGYVELGRGGTKTYYQVFGEKVLSKREDLLGRKEFYSPNKDGPLSEESCVWNFVDKKTGKKTTSFKKAANEIIFLRKHHPKTIHYGLPDIVPAIPYIYGNIFIRDFFLQFFENNAVPQYAIIIEGGKLSADVRQTIQKFFEQDVKGNAHKTLILPVPSTSGEVRVKFEKLSADEKEGSFQETKKNNQTSIMIAHGVSPAIIGIAETANLGSGKGLSQAENYKNRIVVPAQLYWAKELNKLFRMGLGAGKVYIEFEPLDIRDMKEEAEMYLSYLKNGVLTINEVKKYAKLGDPVDGGDRAFIIVGSDILFLDDMSKAPSSILEKLELTKAALEAKIKDANKDDEVLNNEGKKINRNIGNEPQKETTFKEGNPS